MRNSRHLSIAGTLAAVAALSACGSGDGESAVDVDVAPTTAPASTTDASVDFGLVTPDQAAGLAADESITVIDVRTPAEFADGHLAEAVLIDVNDPAFGSRIAELDRDATYLVYCRSGNRSAQAVAAMADIGIDRVYEMDGGIVAYAAAGLPLTS